MPQLQSFLQLKGDCRSAIMIDQHLYFGIDGMGTKIYQKQN
jgi:hypothetical protein